MALARRQCPCLRVLRGLRHSEQIAHGAILTRLERSVAEEEAALQAALGITGSLGARGVFGQQDLRTHLAPRAVAIPIRVLLVESIRFL